MSMLLIAFVLLATLGINGGLLTLALLLIPPVHMYRQLKGAYALSGMSALWRTLALVTMASIAIGVFSTLLLLGMLA